MKGLMVQTFACTLYIEVKSLSHKISFTYALGPSLLNKQSLLRQSCSSLGSLVEVLPLVAFRGLHIAQGLIFCFCTLLLLVLMPAFPNFNEILMLPSSINSTIDAVKLESPSSGGHISKKDVVISFAFMPAARWRLRLNSVYMKSSVDFYATMELTN